MKDSGLIRLGAVWLFIALQAAILTGCQSSPQKNYYVLTSAQTQLHTGSTSLGLDIGIGPVETPEYLSFTQLIYQAPDGSLQRLDNSYWAEPLAHGISRVIGLNLSQAEPSRNLVLYPWRLDSRPIYSVSIKVLTLNLSEGQAKIEATWTLMHGSQEVSPASGPKQKKMHQLQGQHFSAALPGQHSALGLVKAYSQLLLLLSNHIDQALKQHLE